MCLSNEVSDEFIVSIARTLAESFFGGRCKLQPAVPPIYHRIHICIQRTFAGSFAGLLVVVSKQLKSACHIIDSHEKESRIQLY